MMTYSKTRVHIAALARLVMHDQCTAVEGLIAVIADALTAIKVPRKGKSRAQQPTEACMIQSQMTLCVQRDMNC